VLGYALLTVGITAVSHRTLVDEPWLYVIPATVFVAAAWIFERFQSSDAAANDWLRWDLPPLVVAHLVGLLALGLTLDTSTVTPTALAFGGLSLVVGVWKRGRPWVEAGNLLILVAAYDAGPEWLALALVTTSVRAVIFAWRSEGVERLTYQLIGAGSAGWAWLAVVSWQGYSGAEAVGYSALVFGGLTLGLGIASRIWEIRKDTLTVWGGLGVVGVVIAGITDFGLEGSDGPWLALGLGMVAVGGELVAWKAEGTERLVYLLTGATSAGWAWLAVTKWQEYTSAEAVGYSALMFGGLTLALGVASRIWEIRKDTLTVWGGLGVVGVVIAAITDFGLEESGGPWLALGLGMVAIRGGLGAWRSVGVERLAYQVLGAMTAGWAWLAVLSWQGYTPEEGVGYSSMAFGGLALGLAVASRVIDIKRDTLAVWGGLGAGGVFVAGVIGFGLEEPERIGPWLAIGFGVLALAMELAWRKVDPALRVLTVGVTAFAWPALIIGLGWDLSTSVRVSAVVFGLLAVVVAEVGRLQLRGEVAEPGDLGLPVARTWGGLAAAGVVIAALGYEGNAANGYAIASGLATLSVGLARGASPLRLGRLREVAAITALAALNYAADSTGWSQSVFATVLVVLAAAATFSSLVLWRQQKTTTWVTPLVVLAVVVNLETIYFAVQAWPDRAMAVAVLIAIGVQSIAIGTSRSLPSVLALGPPAVGLAFILAVGEGVSGNALWYTVPIALVLLAEVEILRATRRAAGAPPGQDAVVLEWAGIGLLATPPLVEMFTNSLIYGLMAFATAGAILIWAVLTKVRRRTVTAACLALATAVLMIFAAASAAAPESAAFWILAGGIGFAVMLVAALVEAYRTRRGQVMSRLDQLMDGWE
jgi:hypothetical protein